MPKNASSRRNQSTPVSTLLRQSRLQQDSAPLLSSGLAVLQNMVLYLQLDASMDENAILRNQTHLVGEWIPSHFDTTQSRVCEFSQSTLGLALSLSRWICTAATPSCPLPPRTFLLYELGEASCDVEMHHEAPNCNLHRGGQDIRSLRRIGRID
ncbi:unnamed protein product [Aphanomyces euteiches]|uniref:Uncharacterized protein n=1 Tax=Aphanomyces euteiches TaxID=100861 RepID=A0A6G0W6U4_9STRA|nr:hypothetical protein Ae201684_018236 [Aphanomyces euteiches]